MSSSRDITEQVNAKETLEIMALEMRHRLRNAFTVSSAIAVVSAKDEPAHAQFARDLAGRFAALAIAQSQMLENSDKPLLLAELLEIMAAPYSLIEFDGPADLEISDRNARVVALAVGELATNSIKYGALGENLNVRIDSKMVDGRLVITWHEPAVSMPAVIHEGGGSGHKLIARMAKVYGGDFTVAWSEQGLTAHLALQQ